MTGDGDFARDGFTIIRNAVALETLAEVRKVLCDGLRKVGDSTIDGSLDEMLLRREAEDHDHVYQASNFVGSSVAAYRLVAAPGVTDVVERTTGWDDLHVMPMTVSVQFPGDTRYDYKWHQESSFYPWAPRLVNAWIPLVRPTLKDGGTMYVIPGSHQRGSREAESYFSHQTFRQIECGVTDEEEQRQIPMELDLGDYVIFDANLVHRSHSNSADVPRLVCILRYIPTDCLDRIRPLYKALSFEA